MIERRVSGNVFLGRTDFIYVSEYIAMVYVCVCACVCVCVFFL